MVARAGLPATPRWRRPGPVGSHASYQSLLEGSRWDAGKRRHGSVRTSVVPVQGSLRRARFRVSTRRVASSKRTTNPVLGPKIGIGKRRRRTTGSLATSIPFALATCRARRTAALRDESRSPTHLNSKLSIGPKTIASGARLLTASSVASSRGLPRRLPDDNPAGSTTSRIARVPRRVVDRSHGP